MNSANNNQSVSPKAAFKSSAAMSALYGAGGILTGPLSLPLAIINFVMACIHNSENKADPAWKENRNLAILFSMNFLSCAITALTLGGHKTNAEYWAKYSILSSLTGAIGGSFYGLYQSGIRTPDDLKNLLVAYFNKDDNASAAREIDLDLIEKNLPDMPAEEKIKFIQILSAHGFDIKNDALSWKTPEAEKIEIPALSKN